METTANLQLPYLMPSQAQKHVTHNEALALLDAIVQLMVLDRDLTSPPGAPEEGDRYIVAAGATDAWDGQDGRIAARQDGAWIFLSPGTGWLAWVADEGEFLHYTGSAWASVAASIATLQNLALLGVGATADATNPFSAKLNKALWAAKPAGEGGDGDLRYAMNKEGAGNVLSLLMQSGWSGRAELGLIGDDDLSLKVSPDGSNWTTALSIDKTTGATTTQGGSVDAPGLAVADATTGLYDAGSGYLGIAVSGANVVTFGGNNCLQVRRTGSASVTPAFAGESNVIFDFARYSDNASSPVLRMYKARGTTAAPAAVNQGDIGMEFQAQAYGTSAFGVFSQLRFSVEAASPSNTDKKGRMTLLLNSGSGTTTEILRVEHATGLSMFGDNPVIDQNRHHRLRSYTVGTLPSASPAAQMIYVSDGSSNRHIAVSDGTDWRFADGNIVS